MRRFVRAGNDGGMALAAGTGTFGAGHGDAGAADDAVGGPQGTVSGIATTDRIREYLACIAEAVEARLRGRADDGGAPNVLSRWRRERTDAGGAGVRELCARFESDLFERVVRRGVLLSIEVAAMQAKIAVVDGAGIAWRRNGSDKLAVHFAGNINYLLEEVAADARALCDACETALMFY